ncbi:MAG: ribosome silencing factor [Coriobacteriia bacterium]|nr:ribosome silencing factor [Coriobacteriia bacterium]
MTDFQAQKEQARECAIIAAQAADSKKATDIMVQDVTELVGVTDYFVIATAANDRQVRAIVDTIEDDLREKAGVKPLHRETEGDTWSLLDFGDVVVHVFQPEARDHYRLEALWNDAPVMDLAAEAGLTDVEYSDRIAALLAAARQ